MAIYKVLRVPTHREEAKREWKQGPETFVFQSCYLKQAGQEGVCGPGLEEADFPRSSLFLFQHLPKEKGDHVQPEFKAAWSKWFGLSADVLLEVHKTAVPARVGLGNKISGV